MIYEKDWQIIFPTCEGGDVLLVFDPFFSEKEILEWGAIYKRMSSVYKPKDVYSLEKISVEGVEFKSMPGNIVDFIWILKEEWITEIIKSYNDVDVVFNAAGHANKVFHKTKSTPYLWFVDHFWDRQLKDEFISSITRQKNYYVMSWKDLIYFISELIQSGCRFRHSYEWYKASKHKTGNKKIDEFLRVMLQIIEGKYKPNMYFNRYLEELFFADVEEIFNWYVASWYDIDWLTIWASEYSWAYPFTLLH